MAKLPRRFRPLACVVSDFHFRMPAEAAFYQYLRQHGERCGLADRAWDWMVAAGAEKASRLLRSLRRITDILVSLGDHIAYVTNECGLAEQRARVCALGVYAAFQKDGWQRIIHVPSDHDLGVPHLGMTSERR